MPSPPTLLPKKTAASGCPGRLWAIGWKSIAMHFRKIAAHEPSAPNLQQTNQLIHCKLKIHHRYGWKNMEKKVEAYLYIYLSKKCLLLVFYLQDLCKSAFFHFICICDYNKQLLMLILILMLMFNMMLILMLNMRLTMLLRETPRWFGLKRRQRGGNKQFSITQRSLVVLVQ